MLAAPGVANHVACLGMLCAGAGRMGFVQSPVLRPPLLKPGRAVQRLGPPRTAMPSSSTLRMQQRHVPGSRERRNASPMATWSLVGLCATAIAICYADRANIADAIIPMSQDMGVGSSVQGLVLSSFFTGYGATQILGGTLADTFGRIPTRPDATSRKANARGNSRTGTAGGKRVLALAVLMWSLATLLTPSAAKLGVTSLIAARVTMGLGEGPAFPAIHSMIARSVPKASQSTAVGVVTAASYFGTAAAFASCPYLMTQGDGSWEPVFYVFGGLGLLFLPAWLVLTREPLLPAVSDHIHEEALVQQHALPAAVDVRDLVANHKEIQAIVIAQYTQRCVCVCMCVCVCVCVKAELKNMTYSCVNLIVTLFCLV